MTLALQDAKSFTFNQFATNFITAYSAAWKKYAAQWTSALEM